MDFIINNWNVWVIFVALIAASIYLVKNDKIKAKEWLLYAVIEAERNFGPKTGHIKLRYVYSYFIKKFPILSKFISFNTFSKMVDDVLEEMRHLIETNGAVSDYIEKWLD